MNSAMAVADLCAFAVPAWSPDQAAPSPCAAGCGLVRRPDRTDSPAIVCLPPLRLNSAWPVRILPLRVHPPRRRDSLMRTIACWLLIGLATCAVSSAQPLVLLIDDMEEISDWSSPELLAQAEGTTGKALKYTIPASKLTFPAKNLAKLNIAFDAHPILKLDYQIVSGDCKWFGVKLMHAPLAENKQAVWRFAGPTTPKGVWHTVAVDVHKPEYVWGDKPDPAARAIGLRGEAGKEPCVILVDNIRLVKRVLQLEVAETGTNSSKVVAQNVTAAPQTVMASVEPAPRAFESVIEPSVLKLAPGEKGVFTVTMKPKDKSAPLTSETSALRVAPSGTPDAAMSLPLTAVVPLPDLPRPRVMATREQIAAAKRKAETCDWARNVFGSLKKRADQLLQQPVEMPDRGGQWAHWYGCKDCSTGLKTISPTEHRCPVCSKVYTGEPYDSVVLNRVHHGNSIGARDLALAYQLTGNTAYARKAADILLGYAGKYLTYPLHNIHGEPKVGGGRVGAQTLDESTWLIPVAQAYDLIWDALTPPEREQIETKLLRPAAEVIRQHRIGVHNIQCWKNAAVGSVGLAIGDAALVSDAVESGHGLKQQIAKGILEDGSWWELSWGYHFYAMSPLSTLAESASHFGIDVFDRHFERLYEAPILFAMPDLRLPAFNDTGGGASVSPSGNYEVAAARYPKNALFGWLLSTRPRGTLEALLYGAPELPQAERPVMPTTNFAASGIAVLRSRSADNPMYLALDYGPHGGGHGHPDKLGFVFHALGQVLAPDPGSIAYGMPAHGKWYRQTLSHSTLVVDQKSQKPCEGRLNFIHSSPRFQIASVSCDQAYDGVTMDRTVAMIDDWAVLLVDRVRSDKEHIYDWAYHNVGTLKPGPSLVLSPRQQSLGAGEGYDMVKNVAEAATGEPWQADFGLTPDGAKGLRLSMLGVPSTQVFTGIGLGNPPTEKVPMVIVRRKAKEAVFVSLLEPFSSP
ncbi:MAG: hypothetical protein FJ279_04685, partial [Planctomycetes bacterium]|nr:hypothetical protein [Planctomycetota bacterium]